MTTGTVVKALASSEPTGIRTEIICSYDIPRLFYQHVKGSAVCHASTLGSVVRYALELGYTSRKKRSLMNVDEVVEDWKRTITGLATAHDKDQADRYEAAIEKCLGPILGAPIRQVREFCPKLLAALKADPAIPFLVWRGYELWVEHIISKAPDEDIKLLRTDLAAEITAMVEQDVKDQLPGALIRALQWRSPETLSEVKDAVVDAKARGEKPRLRGRESCLFLELGGTEENPAVCVQI